MRILTKLFNREIGIGDKVVFKSGNIKTTGKVTNIHWAIVGGRNQKRVAGLAKLGKSYPHKRRTTVITYNKLTKYNIFRHWGI